MATDDNLAEMVLGIGDDDEPLASNVKRKLKEIAQYSPGRIDQILEQEGVSLVGKPLEAAQRLAMSIAHDRSYCRHLGVDYINLPAQDFRKIKVAAISLSRKNPEIILPLL